MDESAGPRSPAGPIGVHRSRLAATVPAQVRGRRPQMLSGSWRMNGSQNSADEQLLQGIGLESHFIVGQVPSSLLTIILRFAALGLDVAVAELDDRISLPASSANLQQQGTDYGTVVKACLAVARCPGISQWIVNDGHSWIPGTFKATRRHVLRRQLPAEAGPQRDGHRTEWPTSPPLTTAGSTPAAAPRSASPPAAPRHRRPT